MVTRTPNHPAGRELITSRLDRFLIDEHRRPERGMVASLMNCPDKRKAILSWENLVRIYFST